MKTKYAAPALMVLCALLSACATVPPGPHTPEPVVFPAPVDTLVADEFARCEGLAFNGEGDLYVAGDKALWRVEPDGTAHRLCTLFSNLGVAPIGERDLLVADFGRTSAFDGTPRRDGIIWRITPEGERRRLVKKGIIDPNFIVVRRDGSLLVSDDSVNEIWLVAPDGTLRMFSDEIHNPNGMVLAQDGRSLYVAQIFDGITPIVWDDRIWRIPLTRGGRPDGEPELVAQAGSGHDGLAADIHGRLYSASNNSGQILRIDPEDGTVVVICEGVEGVASLAFGQGAFDHEAIYATNHRTGLVFSVHVGVEGAPLHR